MKWGVEIFVVGLRLVLLKDNRFISVEQNAIFYVPANGSREHHFFDVTSFLDEVVNGVAMVDADHILLDDGAVVQYLSHVVSGCSDQLDAPLKCLMVGLRSDKRGQERVMNVDQILGTNRGDEISRKHLHVAGEDDEIAAVFPKQRNLLLLRLVLVFLRYRDHEIRHAVEVGDSLVVWMVGNNKRDFAAQFAALVAVKQVLEAVIVFRNKNADARAMGRMCEPPVHFEVACNGGETFRELTEIAIEIGRVEFNTGEEKIRLLVAMFIGEEDVAVVPENEFGNGSDDSFSVGTGDEQNCVLVHR